MFGIRKWPLIPSVIVLAAMAVMVRLGMWQLDRLEEKEAQIARYEAAQAEEGLQFISPTSPKAAYTRTFTYCADPTDQRATAGRNAKGQPGWLHVSRCLIGGPLPHTRAYALEMAELAPLVYGLEESPMTDAEVEAFVETFLEEEPVRLPDYVIEPADVVLGWSRSPDPVHWDGGLVLGTVVPSGELGFKIVADPPRADLEANATPDPKDLPNNHLAYAGQWFFFALTALVIYILALRRRERDADDVSDGAG